MATVNADAAMIRLPVGTQRMQMPLDCEATSLTIALASVGVHTTQQYVQGHFPTDTRAPVLGSNGLPSEWGDPYTDFVGHVMGSEPGSNPHWATYAGWGAYAPTVARVAEVDGRAGGVAAHGMEPAGALCGGRGRPSGARLDDRELHVRDGAHLDGLGRAGDPLDRGRHVVVLMGVDPVAGTLEFSDPLIGGYNSTTMAQFGRTFSIYGDMAIVIERTAHAAVRAPVKPHLAAVVHPPATHVAVAAAPPWVSVHHASAISIFSGVSPRSLCSGEPRTPHDGDRRRR